jgi:hypothetical protein
MNWNPATDCTRCLHPHHAETCREAIPEDDDRCCCRQCMCTDCQTGHAGEMTGSEHDEFTRQKLEIAQEFIEGMAGDL